jgi:pyruvate formate-lyase activating enzyme-like uncharacterized protein
MEYGLPLITFLKKEFCDRFSRLKMRKVQKTKHYSWKVGTLPKGCEQCVKGEKLVLFVTGLCSRHCYYCPISDQKWQKDTTWANEWKIEKKADIIEEARLCNAQGAGLTGGDPLVKFDRVLGFIRLLKKEFGKDFHIHLYTPLDLVTKQKMIDLHETGLDEIRFHLDIEDSSKWDRLEYSRFFKGTKGVEIPVIPGKEQELKKLIDFIKNKVSFINLNELEISDGNASKLTEREFMPKDRLSYAVKGSEELAKKLLKHAGKTKLNVHYCTAKLKDKVQLRNRIKRRAKNIAKKYDVVTPDGTLVRGIVYLKSFVPSFDYKMKLNFANNKKMIKRLFRLKRELQAEFRIPFNRLDVDNKKLRILMDQKILKKLSRKIKAKNLVPAIVEEYPTYDAMEVEIDFL